MSQCVEDDCERGTYCRDLCVTHYHRWLRTRDHVGPPRIRGTAIEQFWGKVDKRGPGDCWEWLGGHSPKGYGKAKFKGRWVSPHRFSYELHIGPIADGLEIDHLCLNKGCVNPAHLEAITPAENMRRRKEATTHCKRGHEFTPENTKLHSKSGSKVCRACMRDYQREWMRAYRARAKR